MDNIEKHIKANKNEFEVDFPNKHQLWENIEQTITTKKVIPLYSIVLKSKKRLKFLNPILFIMRILFLIVQ